jgi:biopolymer transport protein ExbD
VVIKGDGRVHYEKIMAVMELLKRNDITEIGLATTRQQR